MGIRLDAEIYSDNLSIIIIKGASIVLDKSSFLDDDIVKHTLTCFYYTAYYLEVSAFKFFIKSNIFEFGQKLK